MSLQFLRGTRVFRSVGFLCAVAIVAAGVSPGAPLRATIGSAHAFAPCTPVDTANLDGHWPFDEGSGTTAADTSGNGNNGTLINNPAWTTGTPAIASNPAALSFNGTGAYVDVDNDTAYNFGTNNFTISAFVLAGSGSGNRSVLGNFSSGTRGWGLYLPAAGGVNFFGYGDAGSNDSVQPATVLNGQWHHVAAVYTRSGSSLTIDAYVDGSFVGSHTAAVGDISSNSDLLLGKYLLQPTFQGSLDDVRVYGRALSASEISSLAGGCGDAPPPPPSCPAAGSGAFTGCYYSDQNFTNFQLSRSDPSINFDWGGGSPDPSIPNDHFSARWTGNFTFAPGTYNFTATTDDGMRVWIDGNLVLDKFFDQAATTYTFPETLSGSHLIRVDYYENTGQAVAKLSWALKPATPTCGSPGSSTFTGCYYSDQNFTNLALTRTDPAINFDWGGGSPDPSVPNDHFSARWNGNFTFPSGTYNFTATSDDGIRVWIDGNLVLDKFIDQAATTYTFPETLSGSHLIRVDYYENSGQAVAKLSWALKPAAPTCGTAGSGSFTGCYYSDQNFTNLAVTRNDSAINFDWGGGSPDPSVPSDHFSARWKGNFHFDAANYVFTATADDGIRVWVDGNLVIDHFVDQAATTYTAVVPMIAGQHLIRVDYFEDTGGAVAKVSWAKQAACPAAGSGAFTGCYYSDQNFTNLALTRTDPAINFDWGGGSPDPSVPSDHFSVRWAGTFTFAPGTYTFTATTDDGMKVWIDGNLVLGKFFDQAATTYTFPETLSGSHFIRVDYYENSGQAVARMTWAKTGGGT